MSFTSLRKHLMHFNHPFSEMTEAKMPSYSMISRTSSQATSDDLTCESSFSDFTDASETSEDTEILRSSLEPTERMTAVSITELKLLLSQMASLKSEISQLRSNQNPSPASVPTPASAFNALYIKELKVNVISKYDGHSERLEEFLNAVIIRFLLWLNEFTLNRFKVLTVLGHLEGRAAQWALSITQNSDNALLNDWKLFCEQFVLSFEDHHHHDRLIQRLYALRQTHSIFNYIINFETLCHKVNWSVDVWADAFYCDLKDMIKDSIMLSSVNKWNYYDLKEKAQEMNQRIMSRAAETNTRALPSHPSVCAPAAPSYHASAPPSRSVNPSAYRAPVPGPAAPWASFPMSFSPHDPLTEDERNHHRVNRLCLYCIKPEHMTFSCLIWPNTSIMAVMYSGYPEPSVTPEPVSPQTIIMKSYPLTLSVSNSVLGRKHLIVQRVFRWRTVKVMVNSEVTVNFVNLSWLPSFAPESVWELDLQICALDGRTIIPKNEFKVCTFDIIIDQLPLTKLSAITASCVNYDVVLETPWLHTVNSDIDCKLWMMTPRITRERPLGFIEEPSEPSVPLVELTPEAPVKDPLKLTQTLVVIPLKSSVHDHLKQNQALVKFTLKSPVHDHPETHSDLVKIPLKVLEDSEDYVLDLNAVDYADYLDDEFSFLMYSHRLTEEKVTFAATSVSFNADKPLVADEDWEVPEAYREFTDVFFKGKAETLSEFRGPQVDHVIELTPDFKVFNKPAYNHSEKELQVQRDYISENITRDWIQVSKSSVFSPCMFTVKKNIMNLRLVVDYRSLNAVTVKNRYPLPLIDTLLNRLEGVKYFTRLDLQNAYHLIRIWEGDEWKTAFKTRYGLYEYTVMPFGLTNASVTFQAYIDQVLTGMIDTELIAFLNDILIFESTQKECRKWTLKALQRLKNAKLFCKRLKCLFEVTSVDFLGFIMRDEEIVMNPGRVSMIIEWPVPQNLREIRTFIGFTGFYRRFIKEYFKVAQGMTDLMKKISSPFVWTPEADNCFYVMKQLFIKASVLKQFDPELLIFVKTDAFKFAVSGILSQKHDEHRHSVEFFFKKLGPAEQNYGTPDQELLAVYLSMMHWRHHLEGVNLSQTDGRSLA